MGCGFAFRVFALVLLALVNALDLERSDLLAHVPVQLALQPDEGFVFVRQLGCERCIGHAKQAGELLELGPGFGRCLLDVFRNGPDAGGQHAGRQNEPVAVQNAAAVGRQLKRARKTNLALALEKGIVDDLYVGRAGTKCHKAQRHHGDDEFAAPDGRLARQQRAHRVAHTAAHGCPPAAEAAGVRATGL